MKNTTDTGSSLYLYGITAVTIIGGLLFGYDTAVISGAEQGLEAFFRSASDFEYTKAWHGVTASSALIGCVIGGSISGILASRLGRRNSLRLAALLFFLSALGSFNPEFLFFEYGKPSAGLLAVFNLYRIIGGIGVGLASAVCPMYIAEVAPAHMRGRLVSCNQFAIIFGMLVVYFVNYLIRMNLPAAEAMVTVGWRRMFLSEAFPAAIFGILLFFVPKTPRYLVLNGHPEEALGVLERINGKREPFFIRPYTVLVLTPRAELISFTPIASGYPLKVDLYIFKDCTESTPAVFLINRKAHPFFGYAFSASSHHNINTGSKECQDEI